MPKRNGTSGNHTRRRRGANQQVDASISRQSRPGTLTNTVTRPADLCQRPPSNLLTQRPPKNVSEKIHWLRTGAYTASGLSISNSVETDGAFSFQLSQLSGYSSLTSLFDQFCIYSVNACVRINYNGTTNFAMGEVVTAIDYDNAVTSTFSQLQNYGNSQTLAVVPGMTIQRFIKPCCAEALYSGSAFTNYGVMRCWVDCASPSTAFYGFKICFQNNAITGLTYDFWYDAILGFRDNI